MVLDLKSKEEWEEILSGFSSETKMTSCLNDEAGNHIFCVSDRYPLCSTIRTNQDALTFICAQTNTAMTAVVSKTRKPEVDFCEAGLIRVVVPVVRDGAMVGQITACGLSSDDEELNAFLVSKEVGIPEDKVLELAEATPAGSEDELQELCSKLFDEVNPSMTRTK
jgi:ligand-binding sensor protein